LFNTHANLERCAESTNLAAWQPFAADGHIQPGFGLSPLLLHLKQFK
jgi:hypothetical protein